MPMRRRSGGTCRPPARLTTAPSIEMLPAATRSKPAMQRSAVVLPQPDGPSRQQISPLASARSRSGEGGRRAVAMRHAEQAQDRQERPSPAHRLQRAEVTTRHSQRPYTAAMLRVALALITLLAAALVAVPVLSVGANVFAGGTGGTWAHLAATVLPEYIVATLGLCVGVGIGASLLGVGAAWLVTHLDFPLRRSLRVGAGAAAGHAGLRDGLRLHRPAAVRRPAADARCARRSAGSAPTTGSPTCAARRRGADVRLRALPVRLPAGAHRLPRARRRRCSRPAARSASRRGGASCACRCRWRARPSPPAWRWR